MTTATRSAPQQIPLDALIVGDLHATIPLDTKRLVKMADDYAAGARWAHCPLAVCKTAIGYELLDARLRALVRQSLGEKIVPCRVLDLMDDEKAAFRYPNGKNRASRPVTTEVAS